MAAVAIALVIVAAVLFFAVGLGELFWRSDARRRRAFVRDNEAPR
jgi:nitrogen fixation-related uncharacterized protein